MSQLQSLRATYATVPQIHKTCLCKRFWQRSLNSYVHCNSVQDTHLVCSVQGVVGRTGPVSYALFCV